MAASIPPSGSMKITYSTVEEAPISLEADYKTADVVDSEEQNELQSFYKELESLTDCPNRAEMTGYIATLNKLQGRTDVTYAEVVSHCINLENLAIFQDSGFDYSLLEKLNEKIQHVSIHGCNNFTDESLQYLSRMKNVYIASCPITNQGLEHLKGCDFVSIDNCPITNQDLEHLCHCSGIALRNCPEITSLEKLSQLTWISVTNCPITNNDLAYMKNCKTIRIERCPNITSLKQLGVVQAQSVTLVNCSIQDEDLAFLAKCKAVMIRQCPITDSGLEFLGECSTVYLSKCEMITQSGVDKLKSRGGNVIFNP